MSVVTYKEYNIMSNDDDKFKSNLFKRYRCKI